MPTRYKGAPAEIRALDTYIKLLRAADTVSAKVREQVATFGLSEAQFAVLEALYHLGPLRASEVARKLLRSGANITTVIDNLEKLQLAERRRCPGDRRGVYVHLTPAGTKLLKRIFPSIAGRVTGLMSALDATEQEQLGSLAKKLGVGNAGDPD